MKERQFICLALLGGFSAVSMMSGRKAGSASSGSAGPFEDEVREIETKYDPATRSHEIVFYGASNFRLWTDMDTDFVNYKVQNHGFGGSTDKDLVKYADRILYPYHPDITVFQTGSNDYVDLEGSDDEKISACMEYKKSMFDAFHTHLPDAQFIVMSGLLLPGRSQYAHLTQSINAALADCCSTKDYMTFVDASAMTFNGSEYRNDLFREDGIHLNHTGQLLWRDAYILDALKALTE